MGNRLSEEVHFFLSLNYFSNQLKLGRYYSGTRALFPIAITGIMKVVVGGPYKMIRKLFNRCLQFFKCRSC